MKARVALYHRVSTIDQNKHAAQRELRAAARRAELRVVLDVRETGSGANNDRPGLRRVLDAAMRGKVDVVMVWKLDRFGRSAFDLLLNLRQLDAAGVRFACITQGIDIRPGGDPMSRLLLTMLGAVAEFERNLISERTKLGMEAARRAGKKIGRPRKDLAGRIQQKGTPARRVARGGRLLPSFVPGGEKSPSRKKGGSESVIIRPSRNEKINLL